MTPGSSPLAIGRPAAAHLPDGINQLLDETEATRMLSESGLAIVSAHPEYLRHKSGETTIISYRFEMPGSGREGRGYAQWCARPERADEIHRKAQTLRPRMSSVGVSVLRVDAHTVFYGFPNDARLRRLRWYSSPRKLKRVLAPLASAGERLSKSASACEVLKYKPERRLVSRVDLACSGGRSQALLVRYTTGRQASRLAATARALRSHGVLTPTPRIQLDDDRVGVDDFVHGVELRSWVRQAEPVADQLADALLAFHRTPAPIGTPVRSELDGLANGLNGLVALSQWAPDLSALCQRVAADLAVRRPADHRSDALIHGDLHDKNVLVNGAGPWFIDLERAAVGAPPSDLGRLRAHAISLDIRQPGWSPRARDHAERVIDRYRISAGPDLTMNDPTLAWHCAVALVDQALLVARHVEPGWRESAHALLSAAMDQR